MTADYMQHNPNAETGMAGFKAYFNAIMPKELPPIPETLPGLVAIQAEGDYVTLSFVREYDDPATKGKKYTTTWFDMFRIVNGKIVEHWDSATKGAAAQWRRRRKSKSSYRPEPSVQRFWSISGMLSGPVQFSEGLSA